MHVQELEAEIETKKDTKQKQQRTEPSMYTE